MFQINEVLDLDGQLYRILKTAGDQIVWIEVENKKAFPSLIHIDELDQVVMNESLTRVSDPFSYLLQLTPAHGSKEEQKRDKYLEIIKPLVINDQFYMPKVRAEYIKQILRKGEISKPYLYRLVRQYWQRGQIPNALLS